MKATSWSLDRRIRRFQPGLALLNDSSGIQPRSDDGAGVP